MNRLLVALVAFLLCAPFAFGQGGLQSESVIKSTAAATNCTVRVGSKEATGTPLSPLATIYTSDALTVTKSQPFATDANGNYEWYAEPGYYKEQLSCGGATFTRSVLVTIDSGAVKKLTWLPLGSGTDQFSINGFQAVTLPSTHGTSDDVFIQYCRSTGHMGCGLYLFRYLSGPNVPINEFMVEARYHPAVAIYNSAPNVNISSISRSSNVVTVNTATAHNLWPNVVPGVVVAGVTGCGTSPNGAFEVASIPTSTQFTYFQTGPNETCTPSTGTAQAGARASLVFQHNNSSNVQTTNWALQSDRLNDRTFEIQLLQSAETGDPNDAIDRFLFVPIVTPLSNTGVGTTLQSRFTGNSDFRGYIKSKAFVNDTTGRAAFALERSTSDGSGQAWIALPSTSANTDIAFAATRDWGWAYWRFFNDGTGKILTQNSGSDIATEIASSAGLNLPLATLHGTTGVVKFASSAYGSIDAGLSRSAAGTLAIGNGTFANASGKLVATNITFASSGALNIGSSGVNTPDVGFSRTAAGIVSVGNGTAGDTSGTIRAAAMNAERFRGVGTTPTCSFSAGGGTSPSCSLQTGSTDLAGTIIATTGTGAPGSSGTITLTFATNFGANPHTCVWNLALTGAGAWNARATVMPSASSTSANTVTWDNNAITLSTSTAYELVYVCFAK